MILLLLFLFCLSPVIAQDRLYISQGNDESLGEITLGSGQVNPHVLDLGLWCNEIVVHGTHLFVANSGDNTIQEIDAVTNTTVRVIPVGNSINPWSVAFIGEDTIAVPCWVSRDVALLRYSDGAVIGDLTMPTGPEGILALGNRIYVCETGVDYPNYYNGYLRAYDRGTMQLIDSVQVGVDAQSVSADSLGRLHVVCTGDYGTIAGSIYVISSQTMHIDTVLQVGGTPNTVSFGGGYAFVAAGGFGDAGFVYCYRLSDLAILHDATNPLVTGTGATDVEAMSDGSFYVSCLQTDEVRHHTANGTLLTTYPVSDGPGYMVLYPWASSTTPVRPEVPQLIRIAEAYPNPFNGAVTLVLDGPAKEAGEVKIFNELGQEVAQLAIGNGDTHVRWEGRNFVGDPLPSGSYFALSPGRSLRLLYLK